MSAFYGLIVGIVTDVDDPQQQGRIQVRFPTLPGQNRSHWAPVVSLMAGNERGGYFMPEVGDEAVVAFEHGNPERPYVLGFVWNGVDAPPTTSVQERMIKTRNGHAIRFLDTTPDGANLGALVIEDAHGNRITLCNGKINIKSVGVLEVDAPVIVLKGPGYQRVVTPNSNPI